MSTLREDIETLVEKWEKSAGVPEKSAMRDWQARHALQIRAILDKHQPDETPQDDREALAAIRTELEGTTDE